MILIESPDTNLKQYMPSDLSECDARQYIEMCQLIFQLQNGQISYEDLKTHAVYKLMNMIPSNKKPKSEDEEANKFSNVYRLAQQIESFFDTNEEGQKIIKQHYIHNPVPQFRPAWKTYYGPTDQFMNIKFNEYTDALRLFHQFNATGEMELLYDMVAILYRPKKAFHFICKYLNSYDGDIREAYNIHHIEKRAKDFKYAPLGFIYGVYLYFASFQKLISTAKVPWGGKELDLSILFEPADSDEVYEQDENTPDIGMDSVMFMMAESGAFGSRKELGDTSIWMIWIRMYEIRRKDLELIKQQEKDAEHNPT